MRPIGTYRDDNFFDYFGKNKPSDLCDCIDIMKTDNIYIIKIGDKEIPLIHELAANTMYKAYLETYGAFMKNIDKKRTPYVDASHVLLEKGIKNPVIVDSSNVYGLTSISNIPEDAEVFSLCAHTNRGIWNQIASYAKNTTFIYGLLYHHDAKIKASYWQNNGYVDIRKSAETGNWNLVKGYSLKSLMFLFNIEKIDYLILRGFPSNFITLYSCIDILKENKTSGEVSMATPDEIVMMTTILEMNGFSCEPINSVIYFQPKTELCA